MVTALGGLQGSLKQVIQLTVKHKGSDCTKHVPEEGCQVHRKDCMEIKG